MSEVCDRKQIGVIEECPRKFKRDVVPARIGSCLVLIAFELEFTLIQTARSFISSYLTHRPRESISIAIDGMGATTRCASDPPEC